MPIRNDAVGQRVRVYWTDENEWFAGQVKDADAQQGYFVLYDDGDERWEAPEQLVEFEDGKQQEDVDNEHDDDDETEQQQQQRTGDHAPRMMEPPASPTNTYDEEHDDYNDEDEDEDDSAHQHEESKRVVNAFDDRDAGDDSDDDSGGVEKIGLASAAITRTTFLQDDDSEDDEQHDSDVEDDGEQSIAMSEVPIMFERRVTPSSTRSAPLSLTSRSSGSSSSRNLAPTAPAAVASLPVRGVLLGKVLRASHLPSLPVSRAAVRPPSAFVKIAFVEAALSGDKSAQNVMLRCKNVLTSTSVARQAHHPVWNSDDAVDDTESDGAFQMQLVPPPANSSSKEPPSWLSLGGDMLFSVYSASDDDEHEEDQRGRRQQVHDFIGQAVISLREIVREVVLGGSLRISRCLPLQTRQGKPLAAPSASRPKRAVSDDDDDEAAGVAPEIVVTFGFEPTYADDTRQHVRATSKAASHQSTRSLAKDRGSTRSLASQPKTEVSQQRQQQTKAASSSKPAKPQQAKKTLHTSSSTINRRKLEKQIDQQNVAFAKRLEWRDERRVRVTEYAKAQAKSRQPIPQHGSMKHDHKASSGVNRSKFQQQVREENRAMEKRLHAIVLKDETKGGGRDEKKRRSSQPATPPSPPIAKISDIAFDALDKDEVLARDRRQERLREKDFLMQQAQHKYQQQNQVVDSVMALQTELAELRTQVFSAKAAVTRLDVLNNKDQHLCRCLRSAAEASSALSSGSASLKSIKRKPPPTNGDSFVPSGDDGSSAGITRQSKELELLKKEAASLGAEKQTLSQELKRCNQTEHELDDEVHRLATQLRFVQAKQSFRQRMSSSKGGGSAELQMKKRQQLLELSKEEEELLALHQAQQELTQLQIAVQVLKERQSSPAISANAKASSASSSSAACEYLEKKIGRQKQKLEQLEQEQRHFQREYEALAVSCEQEKLRKHVHELQQTLFLCQAQQKHLRAAQWHAHAADEKLSMALQTQLFNEQTETEILFKKKGKHNAE